MTQRKS